MLNIKKITHYEFDGQQFNSIQDIRTYVQNNIGVIIDAGPLRLPAKDRLQLFDNIVKNRKRLADLLNVTVESESPESEDDHNILDEVY